MAAETSEDVGKYEPSKNHSETNTVMQNGPKLASDELDCYDVANDVLFGVDEHPPLPMSILLGFQHYMAMFIATLTVPFLISKAICMGEDHVGLAKMIGTIFTASGVITLLQTGVGVRLPIVQAGTFALLAPTLAYFELEELKCPKIITAEEYANMTVLGNETWIISGSEEHQEVWMSRLRDIQGAIMTAAVLEIIVGGFGIIGWLLRFIGPLTIFPTVTLLGMQMAGKVADSGSSHWGICVLTMVIIAVFSQYLGRFNIPCIGYTKEKGIHRLGYPLFKMFPLLLGICVSWLICFILTICGKLPSDPNAKAYLARTDIKLDAIYNSPWFRVPYPGQWGLPTVSVAAVVGILSGIIATTIESVGDYHACAKFAGAPAPPIHAINRGILVEGIGSFLDGIVGTGNGTTSTSINVGVVGISKVGSRRVVQLSAVFMIGLGLFTKFGAIFITIPEPVIGAAFYILFSMIVAVGISNLQHVDMNSGRNLFIIGFSLFVGLSIPLWVSKNPGAISTGFIMLDNVLTVLLKTAMFVGGMLGCFLDNTIPGTKEERGLAQWQKARAALERATTSAYLRNQLKACYDLPFSTDFLRKYRWTYYIPILPHYKMPRDWPPSQVEDIPLKGNLLTGVTDTDKNALNV